MINNFPYIIIIFVAFGGLILSLFIRHKKQAREIMICPLKADCNAVIQSEYSYFLGIPIELLGIAYYGLVALTYAVFLVLPNLVSASLVFIVLAISTSAFLFSLYLTFIQAFLLKQWCTWCLVSAGFTTVIFFLVIFASEIGFVPVLAANVNLLYALHFLGIVLGLGAATVADVLFFNFLKDFRISKWESGVIRVLSQVIWLGLALIVVAGMGIYLPYASVLNQASQFLLKVIVVLVLIICSAFYNLLIQPRLAQISFKEKHNHTKVQSLRRAAFALGAVALVSWYAVFFLEMLYFNLSFAMLFVVYLVIISVAIIISQFIEQYLNRKAAP